MSAQRRRLASFSPWLAFVLVSTLLSAPADETGNPDDKRKRVHVLTRQGDVLLGSADLPSLTIETRYGSLTIPASDLRRVDFALMASAEETQRIEELLSDLENPSRRDAARSGLLALGPVALRGLPSPGGAEDDDVRKALEDLRGMLLAKKGRRSVDEDVVLMKRFNVVGAVKLETLEIETTYGPLRIARHDLDRLFFAGATVFRETDRVLIVKSWTDPNEEYQHTRTAISRYSKIKLVEFTGTTGSDLKKALLKHSIVVLPEFEQGGSAAQAAARDASSALKKFVREGGVLISCGGSNNAQFLSASGLLTCKANANDSTGSIRKRHPILKGVSGGVPSTNATIPLTQIDGRKMKSLVVSPNGATIVGVATYGSGAIVYCGWDFFQSGDVHQRILANAVQWAATREFSGLPITEG